LVLILPGRATSRRHCSFHQAGRDRTPTRRRVNRSYPCGVGFWCQL